MPRGIHQDRASFPGMVSTRIVNSEGNIEGYIILSERIAEHLPPEHEDTLWRMLDAVDEAEPSGEFKALRLA